MIDEDKNFPYQTMIDIRQKGACFDWCLENLALGTWCVRVAPQISYTETYIFKNKEDLMAFKLTWD